MWLLRLLLSDAHARRVCGGFVIVRTFLFNLILDIMYMYVCMYVKIRRHQHTRVHAHTGPRRHTRAPACHILDIVCDMGSVKNAICNNN